MKTRIIAAALLACATSPASAIDLDFCMVCARWAGTCATFDTPNYTVCPAAAEHKVVVSPPSLQEDGTNDGKISFTFYAGNREISFSTEPSTVAGVGVVTRFDDTLWDRHIDGARYAVEWQEGDARGTCDYRGSQVRCDVAGLKTDVCTSDGIHSHCNKDMVGGARYLITYRLLDPAPPIQPHKYDIVNPRTLKEMMRDRGAQ